MASKVGAGDFVELYCICLQEEYGEMICCDNQQCDIGWFHYECVGLTTDTVPSNDETWYCSECNEQSQQMKEATTPQPKRVQNKAQRLAEKTQHDQSQNDITKQRQTQRTSVPKFTQKTLESNAISIVEDAIQSIAANKLFDGDTIQGHAQDILLKLKGLDSPQITSIVQGLVSSMWPSLATISTSMSSATIEEMCVRLNILRLDSHMMQRFEKFLMELGVDTGEDFTYFFQFFIRDLVHSIMKTVQNANALFEPVESNVTLDKCEEQTLRYVAGYVVRKTTDNFSKDTKCANFLKETVRDNNANTVNFLTYTRELLLAADRGGLVHISDNMYCFFRAMEFVVNPLLKVKNAKLMVLNGLTVSLLQAINESAHVHASWEVVVADNLDTTTAAKVLDELSARFVNIRIRAFTSAYMYIVRKREKKCQKSSSKPLRKQVNKE